MKVTFSLVTLEMVVWSSWKKSERSKLVKMSSLKTFYDQFPGISSENEEIDVERSTYQDT